MKTIYNKIYQSVAISANRKHANNNWCIMFVCAYIYVIISILSCYIILYDGDAILGCL